jgi:hypothetical protein
MQNDHLFPLQDWDSESHEMDQIDWNDDILYDNMSVSSFNLTSAPPRGPKEANKLKIPSNPDNVDRKKISDTVVYGPRFCLLFDRYCERFNLRIDIKQHLMTLCSEHLVRFINWARESNQQATWVSNTLFDYDYLRPEVRNGIVMILIYTFAAKKATVDPSSMDMFTTLQDAERGLAIANKFSLKIYNDPILFLTFLKTSISALIDAGVIPENERMNGPKKGSKEKLENKEEHAAYVEIVRRLVVLLEAGDVTGAKALVQHLTTYWQVRGKVSIHFRFSFFELNC